ncbi:MAG: sulfatase-like hydrolase/transferase, partial [Dehalococcoidia bacterium]
HLSGEPDDWEQALIQAGYGGQEYATGVNNNDYMVVPWHLPDHLHPTNWTARELSGMIQRRDPDRPGFWYLSFTAPHPPLWPPQWYYDCYRDVDISEPHLAPWREELSPPPSKWEHYIGGDAMRGATPAEILDARRGFYALQTHIDHQIRVVLGTFREAGLLENTAIIFTSDHGDMLGTHGMWAKSVMYEDSARVPLVVVPPATHTNAPRGINDDRLAELRDIMPTLLNLAGIEVPGSVEGFNLLGEERREHLYGEHGEGLKATRMVVRDSHKLIYYPEGNRFQLFDLGKDPQEMHDLAGVPEQAPLLEGLKALLAGELYGEDPSWIQDGVFVGLPTANRPPPPNFSFSGQRGQR